MWSGPAVPMIVTFLPSHFIAAAVPARGSSRSATVATRRDRSSRLGLVASCTLAPSARRRRIWRRPRLNRKFAYFAYDKRPATAPRLHSYTLAARMKGGIYVLNFYSAVFGDQLKRGRKTATIRLGDKSNKYERGQVVWITVCFRHSPREKIFTAVIDDVEVKRVGDLSRRDIEHDNPEFRRLEETTRFLEQIYSRPVAEDDLVTVIRFSQIVEPPRAHLGNGETPRHN